MSEFYQKYPHSSETLSTLTDSQLFELARQWIGQGCFNYFAEDLKKIGCGVCFTNELRESFGLPELFAQALWNKLMGTSYSQEMVKAKRAHEEAEPLKRKAYEDGYRAGMEAAEKGEEAIALIAYTGPFPKMFGEGLQAAADDLSTPKGTIQ